MTLKIKKRKNQNQLFQNLPYQMKLNAGKVNHVVDGDTLDINDIRIRLSLVDTPERGDSGFKEATQFVVKLCLGENAEVDMDDGQRRGSFGREIGVVYCDGKNLNEQLMDNNLGIIDTRFCEKS